MLTFSSEEILETIRMVEMEGLDIRAVTLSVNTLDCADGDIEVMKRKLFEKVVRTGAKLVEICDGIGRRYGIPIVNRRAAITPVSLVAAATGAKDYPRRFPRQHIARGRI